MTDNELKAIQQAAADKASMDYLFANRIQPYVWIDGERQKIVRIKDVAITEKGLSVPVPNLMTAIGRSSHVAGKLPTGETYLFKTFAEYQSQFNGDFELGFDIDNFPFLEDQSWRNDACPSFVWRHGHKCYLMWIDHEEASHRDFPQNKRYLIVAYNEADYGDMVSAEGVTALETDIADDVIAFLTKTSPSN